MSNMEDLEINNKLNNLLEDLYSNEDIGNMVNCSSAKVDSFKHLFLVHNDILQDILNGIKLTLVVDNPIVSERKNVPLVLAFPGRDIRVISSLLKDTKSRITDYTEEEKLDMLTYFNNNIYNYYSKFSVDRQHISEYKASFIKKVIETHEVNNETIIPDVAEPTYNNTSTKPKQKEFNGSPTSSYDPNKQTTSKFEVKYEYY